MTLLQYLVCAGDRLQCMLTMENVEKWGIKSIDPTKKTP
jgi:hypothetical protein